jgi:superfamily I DNA/RNA helicase
MNRIKGLEFPCIFLVAVNDGVLPSASNSTQNDSIEKAETETRERSLLFVAATRARDKLIISSFGQPSPFLQSVVGNFGDRTLNDLQLNEHHLSF